MNEADNLLDLYLYTVVVEAGGFSAAARQSGTTKSRLSRRVIELEKRLGARLLHRDARRFSMTPMGEQVYRHALHLRDAAQAVAAAAKGALGGHVRIHASDALLGLVSGMLDAFNTQHPDTRLNVMMSGNGWHALLNHHTDVALHAGTDLPDSADIVAHPLGALRQVVVASPRLLAQAGRPDSPGSIPDQQLIELVGWEPAKLSVSHGRRSSPRFASNQVSSLMAAARAGLGFACLPLYLCHDDIRQGQLQVACPTDAMPIRPLYALTRQREAAGHATHDMIRFIRKHLEKASIAGVEPAAIMA